MQLTQKLLHLLGRGRALGKLGLDALNVGVDSPDLLSLASQLNQGEVDVEPHGRTFVQRLVERPQTRRKHICYVSIALAGNTFYRLGI